MSTSIPDGAKLGIRTSRDQLTHVPKTHVPNANADPAERPITIIGDSKVVVICLRECYLKEIANGVAFPQRLASPELVSVFCFVYVCGGGGG